jgi:hypothetical protein
MGIAIIAMDIAVSIIPSNKQLLALCGSSSFIIKYAITPPTILKKIGRRNHKLLLFLDSIIASPNYRI